MQDRFDRAYGLAEEGLDENLVLRILTDVGVPVASREFVRRFGTIDSPLRIAQLVLQCRIQGSYVFGRIC
jgi:hypothetical protein